MMKLRLVVAFAASAAMAPMAAAQTVTDPDPYSAPPMTIAGAAGAGAARAPVAPPQAPSAPRGSHWGARGPSAMPRSAAPAPAGRAYAARPPAGRPQMPAPARPGGHYAGQMPGGQIHGGQMRGRSFQGGQFHGRSFHGGAGGGARFGHFQRIHRGGFVPQFWWGPQFVVRNWGGYGFPQPFAGGRWIRYYDDALLIDRYGRVYDARSDWNWEREGDRWSQDDNGVPVYVGDDDFEPGKWDYEWAERWDRREVRDEEYVEQGPPPAGYGFDGAYAHGGYGYASAYGYAPCACGPVVVTETTVTTPAVVEQVTYYDYVEERVARPAAKVRSKRVKVQRVPVTPYAGEKG